MARDEPSLAAVHLTPMEVDVIRLLASGLCAKEIAQRFTISVNTVESHKRNLMRKLDLHKETQVVIYAFRNGYAT